jgi:CobQ-like glutamine amidotransferase family enzyme
MLGHRSQFSFSYGDFEQNKFIDIEIGIGMNPETKAEGLYKNNFFATYSLGPYLIMNPLFAKYLLRKIGVDDSLAFEKEAVEAYEYRRDELRKNLG